MSEKKWTYERPDDRWRYPAGDLEVAADLPPQTLKTWQNPKRGYYLRCDNEGWSNRHENERPGGWRRYSDLDIARVAIMAALIRQGVASPLAFAAVREVTPRLIPFLTELGFFGADHSIAPSRGVDAYLVAAFVHVGDEVEGETRDGNRTLTPYTVVTALEVGDDALAHATNSVRARFEDCPTGWVTVDVGCTLYRARARLANWLGAK